MFFPPHRRYKEKKEEAAEPEADPERDQRTVFAYQVNLLFGHKIFQVFYFLVSFSYCIFLIMSTDILCDILAR